MHIPHKKFLDSLKNHTHALFRRERITTTMRRMNGRTMTFFAVVSSSLLFLIILFEATSITGVHAQKALASFEAQNPSSSLGKTTTRTTPETITAEDDDDSAQKDARGSEGARNMGGSAAPALVLRCRRTVFVLW